MRILHVSHSDTVGGAARAAYRIHRAVLGAGAVSRMWVRRKESDDRTVEGRSGGLGNAIAGARASLGRQLLRLQRTAQLDQRSVSIVPSRWSRAINAGEFDVVHLHWLAAETMSISEIDLIRKPIVWTLHDMWGFCGAEHYAPDGPDARWRHGYTRGNAPALQTGIDLDRWTWNRKRRAWYNSFHIVCPSHWLAECARQSALMRDWSVETIAYPLDTQTFKPLDRKFCRTALNLPLDHRIILFGASGDIADPRKGFDLLREALRCWPVQGTLDGVSCVIFGQSKRPDTLELSLPTHWMGRVHDDATLALLYCAADVAVIPSRQDNLVQIGIEAQACGCPIVAFGVAGNFDVTEHGETGYLVEPYNARDLARGIAWILEDEERRRNLGRAARKRAVQLWSPTVIASRYLEVYRKAIDAGKT
jgi:glycosyltransferase involved in cell wall biosynthesis